MTRIEWKEYFMAKKDCATIPIDIGKQILSDWNKEVKYLNERLRLLMNDPFSDEMFKLIEGENK